MYTFFINIKLHTEAVVVYLVSVLCTGPESFSCRWSTVLYSKKGRAIEWFRSRRPAIAEVKSPSYTVTAEFI